MGLLFKEEKEREENTRTYIEKGTSMQGRKRGIKKRAIRQSCDTLMILFLTHFFFFLFFDDFISHPFHPSFPSAIYFSVITLLTERYVITLFSSREISSRRPPFFLFLHRASVVYYSTD